MVKLLAGIVRVCKGMLSSNLFEVSPLGVKARSPPIREEYLTF